MRSSELGRPVVERDGLDAGPPTAKGQAEAAPGFSFPWKRFILAIGLGAAGFFLLQPVDVAVLRCRGGFMPMAHDGFGDQVLEGFKNFSQPLTIGAALVLVVLYDVRWKRIVLAILIAQFAAKLTYDLIKTNVVRQRPLVMLEQMESDPDFTIEQTWQHAQKGDARWGRKSFPSGHTASAFALAGTLAWYYRRAAILWWLLALGCGTTRVLHAAHWPSDCVVGAAIGYLAAVLGLWLAHRGRLSGPVARHPA